MGSNLHKTHISTSRVHQDRFPTINYDLHIINSKHVLPRVLCLAVLIERDNSTRKVISSDLDITQVKYPRSTQLS